MDEQKHTGQRRQEETMKTQLAHPIRGPAWPARRPGGARSRIKPAVPA